MGFREGQLKLGVFSIASGYHAASWRHPDALPLNNFDDWATLAQLAEAGKLDMVFIADGVASNIEPLEIGSRVPHSTGAAFEPITLLSSLAAVTKRVGLAATVSSTYTEPYNLARLFGSLDRLSNGRAAWNIVTSHQSGAAENFGGIERLEHDARYERAEEYLDVVRGLWDSWDDDAFVADRVSGRFFDPDKVHYLNHVGKHYRVRGPLNMPRSPQGYPVLIQAGSSGPGMNLAARVAEVIFCALPTLAKAQAFYADVKQRVAGFGRDPENVLIMPGLMTFVGRTRAEAEAKRDKLRSLIDESVAVHNMQQFFGTDDLTKYSLDEPLPQLELTQGNQSRQALILEKAYREKLTLRETALAFADSGAHMMMVGTPEEIADEMIDVFEARGADGFNLLASPLPSELSDFIHMVVPELRRRGRFRTEYEGVTLRENLGLSRPPDRSTASSSARAPAMAEIIK